MLVACGGDSDDGGTLPTAVTAPAIEVPEQPGGTLDEAALVEAADINCGFANDQLGRLGPAGKTLEGIKAQWTGSVPVLEEVQDLQTGLDAGNSKAWDQYLKANQATIDAYAEIAATPDEAALTAGFEAQQKALAATYPPADALGLEVCTYVPEATVTGTEMNDPVDFDLAEPSNTVEQAAETFIGAVDSGSCPRINAQRNSDVSDLQPGTCKYLVDTYANLEVVGTESYGPVAMATFAGKGDDSRSGTVQFVIDQDLELKYVNESVIPGGAIHPPSEGFDAQETMDSMLESIRDQDGEAFLDLQGPDGAITEVSDPFDRINSEEGGRIVAEDIRENPDVEAVMIGANQAVAYFIFDTGERDYLLENNHVPGSETAYRNFGYWALPPQ